MNINGTGTTQNVVAGDFIGTDKLGGTALGNGGNGVEISANGNTVGELAPATGADTSVTVISGNKGAAGVYIASGSNNTVINSYIGTDVSGTQAIPNIGNGVDLGSGATQNTIGGTTDGSRNVISGNGDGNNQASGYGVVMLGAPQNFVQGNYIGTDATGTQPLGNYNSGIWLQSGANNNIIGGPAQNAGNVISANAQNINNPNTGYGLYIGFGSNDNKVDWNYIGRDNNGFPDINLQNGGATNAGLENGSLQDDGADNKIGTNNLLQEPPS